MPDNEPVGNITQFTQREQGGQQKIKQRPTAVLFFSYQTPRAFTAILRAQTPGRKATQRSRSVPSTHTPQRLVRDGQSRHFLQ